MVNERVYDAVVLGAGLAGSTAAAGLAASGWDVLLVEKDSFPRHKVCGEFLSPESQSALDRAGLAQAVIAQNPVTITQAQLVTTGGTSLSVPLPGEAWGMSRFTLDQTLAQGAVAQGATLWTETAAQGFEQNDDGLYVVTVSGDRRPKQVQTRMVLAALGRHSRGTLPPKPVQRDRKRLFVGVKSHFEGIECGDRVELYFFRGGYCGINQVESGAANVCLLASYDAFAEAGRSVPGMIRQAAEWNPALAERLAPATPLNESACAVAPVDTYRPSIPWDGAPCLGDTATMIPPLCGDGMAMALHAADLAVPLVNDYLHGRLDRNALADRYSQGWHQLFDNRLRTGRFLQRALDLPLLSDALLRLGNAVPPLANYLVRATRG